MEKIKQEKPIMPSSAGIITTYKCTAECEDCCFNCSRKKSSIMNKQQLIHIIDELISLKSVKVIVFTGGEATLLGNVLIEGINYANKNGFATRLVTNGHWVTNSVRAENYIQKLKDVGLKEINFSTGDQHQKYVRVDNVLLGSLIAIEHGIPVSISLETHRFAKFRERDLKSNPIFKKIMDSKNKDLFTYICSSWISIKNTNKYGHNNHEINLSEMDYGCDNLYSNISVDSNNNIYSCCGLTIHSIKEMSLGNIEKILLEEAINNQLDDLLKKWIFLVGPYHIIKKTKEWNSKIEIPKLGHRCLYCAYIYNNPLVIETIIKNIKTIRDEIESSFIEKTIFYKNFN
ncbi:radical SAM protein [Enterococcus hirae]|uniref:radical SAM protein n=1 Tax=Enterococcus hirae TaxID=1354 RepID=UPI0039A51475